MSKPTQPSEIAREVLRQLAMRRTLPTPDNYLALYHEIAGTVAQDIFPEKAIKSLATALPRKTAEQSRFARQIEVAAADKSWEALKGALLAFSTASAAEPPQWSVLLRDLMLQLERNQAGMTPVKKREAIERVIQASSSPDLLFSRMQSLLNSWSQGQGTEADQAMVEAEAATAPKHGSKPQQTGTAAPASTLTNAAPGGLNAELQELIAQLLENSVEILLVDTPDLAGEATRLAADIRAIRSPAAVAEFTARMKKFSYRLQFVTEDQAELKKALLHLLHLIIENISELALDDQWMHGQIALVLDLFQQPLSLRQLDDVERRMKEVIYKQSALKSQLQEAQNRLKAMLASFVDRLADFSESTSGYHDKIESCAEKISKASNISELSNVLDEVMHETRLVQLNAQRSRDEMQAMRLRVDESEKEVTRLQGELAQASEMVRHDPLTGALNRKGLDEVLERELAQAQRHDSTLCIALLDIDNFKKLNDTHGHQVGDDALVHLARVTRETIRPQDSLARYGGEEFIILLPDTSLNEAVLAVARLQRELTRKFFMNKNEKLLITFSAGVAEKGRDEPSEEVIKRADAAMYLAKRSGKNRVLPA
ncbi:MAG: diguanylate cyclase [Betaproteobacteria bacterium]|nr:diguanylate cyclase [Betaproteobacteria bacterium]